MERLARAAVLACVVGVGNAVVEEGCSTGNGRCTCGANNARCLQIKPFFEEAVDGCAGVPHQTCGNNFGYKSCFKKPDMTCNTDQCWLWTVDVMAVCPEFFPDLSSSPLAVCNASIVGTYDKTLTFAYEDQTDGQATGCSKSHGECTKLCGTRFNQLIDDDQCGAWLRSYAARAPVMKGDLDVFIARCDARRTQASSWWLLGLFISILGFVLLTIAFLSYKHAKRGTDAQEANPDGVGLDKIAAKRQQSRAKTMSDYDDPTPGDDDDDI